MSSLYLRPAYKKEHPSHSKYTVWISFTDQYHQHHSVNTHFVLQKARIRTRGNQVLWPEYILSWQSDLDREIALGHWGKQSVVTRTVTLSESFNIFSANRRRDLTASTIKIYQESINILIGVISDKPVQAITSAHISTIRTHLLDKYSDQFGRKTMRTIHAYFTWLVNSQFIDVSPVKKQHSIAAVDPPPRPFTQDEITSFLREAKVFNYEAFRSFLFIYLSGFRPSEVNNLQWKHIDMKNRVINVPNIKEHRFDVYPMDQKIYQFLKVQSKAYNPYVFKYRHKTSITHIAHKIIEKLHLDPALKLYALRKTYARNIIQSTGNIQIAQELLRHRSIQTTLRHYSFFSIDEKRKALEHSRLRKASKG